MALATGTRFGPYQVIAPLGAGGMGEVYRATDSRLARDVAIKVLPAALSLDRDHLARFEREGRALASLNHPNIATVHGLEEASFDNGVRVRALVMELVDGVTLADRIAKGRLPAREASAVARQIADALEAAHEHGIVHRDLKPRNVMIRPDGTVKVLDFGLAKDVRAASAPDVETAAAHTVFGTVVGTPAYMSPEQARGEPVDRRTDIWAFGCVLFELLTGTRTFAGRTTAETISRVQTQSIDWSLLPAGVPAALQQLLTRCLERDARRRLRDIGEARIILEDCVHGAPGGASRARPARWRLLIPVAASAMLVGATLGGLVTRRLAPTAGPSAIVHTAIPLADGQTWNYPGRRFLAIAPSGNYIAYTAGTGLWRRALADPEARLVPGVGSDARGPFFSPDSQSLGYYASGSIWRVSLTDGAPTRVVAAVNPWGTSWGADGAILYSQGRDGIWRVPDTGGEGTCIITAGADETLLSPQLLPDGDWVLFTVLPAGVGLWDQARIVVQSLSSGERVTVVDGGRDARYLPSGHLVYALRDKVMAAPFDAARRTLGATAVPVLAGVSDARNITGAAQFDVASSGTLVYAPRSLPDRLTLTWVDRSGREEAIPSEARAYSHPRVSRDGRRVAIEVAESDDADIWTGDFRGALSPLTIEDGEDGFPIWSPDDSRIAYTSTRSGGGIFSRPTAGTGPEHVLVKGAEWRSSTWTGDGRLVYEQLRGGQVAVMARTPGDAPSALPLVNIPSYFDLLHVAISPDGRWLAYHSTESGQSEVYIRPYPNVLDQRWQVSRGGGYSATWAPDGRSLFFIEGLGQNRPSRMPDSHLMMVPIETRPVFAAKPPQRLFRLRDYVSPNPMARDYDVAPDGRFLMLKDVTPGGLRVGDQIRVVQRWLEDLQARVPATR